MQKARSNQDLLLLAKNTINPFKSEVKRRAKGALIFDYLVPSGYYQEQWDWDAFFIGIALASDIPSEGIYLRNITLNLLSNARSNGYIPGCITPNGAETGHRSFIVKPFVAQGAYQASIFLNDFSWIESYFDKLRMAVLYREKNLWNKEFDLGVWSNSMSSGADNNPAVLNFPPETVIGTDLNTFIYQEYKAIALIAKKINKKVDQKYFDVRASEIKNNINNILWNKENEAYCNMDTSSKTLIKRIGYNSIHPLWACIAPQDKAQKFIKRYVLKPNKLWGKYGTRSLSKDDPKYNNENIIKPYSNWQGPIWPIANYFFVHALLNYGYKNQALNLARRIVLLCIEDIKKTGGMHENYDAETGKPLAAPNFISWNLLVPSMFEDALQNKTRFIL